MGGKITNSNKGTCCHGVPASQGPVLQWIMCPAKEQETAGWGFCRSPHLESDALALLEGDLDEKKWYPDVEPQMGWQLILSPL